MAAPIYNERWTGENMRKRERERANVIKKEKDEQRK